MTSAPIVAVEAGVFEIVTYRVFIKYCAFSKILKYSGRLLSLFSLGPSVCTRTRQVEHQRHSRTGRVQKNHKILREKHNI